MVNAARWSLVPYTRGFGVEVTEGHEQLFPHFHKAGMQFMYRALDDLHMLASQQLDFFVTDHKEPTFAMIEEWWRVVKQGGHLCFLFEPDYQLMERLDGWDQLLDGPHIWV